MGFTTDSITEGKKSNKTTLIYNSCPSHTKSNVKVKGYRPFMLLMLVQISYTGLQDFKSQVVKIQDFAKISHVSVLRTVHPHVNDT